MLIAVDIRALVGNDADITLFILMSSIGLSQRLTNMAYRWRRLGLLARCLLASFVVMPLAAIST